MLAFRLSLFSYYTNEHKLFDISCKLDDRNDSSWVEIDCSIFTSYQNMNNEKSISAGISNIKSIMSLET